MTTLDEFIATFTEEERHTVTLAEVWNAAVDATVELMLEEGCIDRYYEEECMDVAKLLKA